MHLLTRRLEKAVIVEPRTDAPGKIFFGAIVLVEDEDCVKAKYQIVGEDEIDLKLGRISWRSPLGRALLGKKEDDTIVFRKPSGDVELTILAVRYESGPLLDDDDVRRDRRRRVVEVATCRSRSTVTMRGASACPVPEGARCGSPAWGSRRGSRAGSSRGSRSSPSPGRRRDVGGRGDVDRAPERRSLDRVGVRPG